MSTYFGTFEHLAPSCARATYLLYIHFLLLGDVSLCCHKSLFNLILSPAFLLHRLPQLLYRLAVYALGGGGGGEGVVDGDVGIGLLFDFALDGGAVFRCGDVLRSQAVHAKAQAGGDDGALPVI